MIKKINSKDLKPGMFVHDFNCGWMNHPFIKNSLMIESDEMVGKVMEHGIKELYVDTEKSHLKKNVPLNNAQTLEEADRENAKGVKKAIEYDPEVDSLVPMMEEIDNAVETKTKAKEIVTSVLNDIHSGKDIELDRVDEVVEEMVDSVIRNKHALTSLGRVKDKDQYTYMHSVNVAILMISFCRTMKMSREDLAVFGSGALLHDIGKMRVSQELLNKPGKLTELEFDEMKSHVVHSGTILRETAGVSQKSIDVASQHHERFDGSGYPHGLKGKEISPGGQMSSIVDVYDAITSDRCYHKGLEPMDALKKIFEWSKFHFNPKLVQFYVRSIGVYPVGTLVRLESDFLGVVVQPGETDLTKPLIKVMYDAKSDWIVTPRNLDLSVTPKNGIGCDRIVSTESPIKWKINPLKYVEYFNNY